jgi:hypothetical protein
VDAEDTERMTIETWLEWAVADADRRSLPELKPLLESLASVMHALRSADFNDRADDDRTRRADR